MAVRTDNPAYGGTLLPAGASGPFEPCARSDADSALCDAIFGAGSPLYCAALLDPRLSPAWTILARDAAPSSQYDALIELARSQRLPDRLACLARSGAGFRGFKGRTWSALPGNIHLTIHLAPERRIDRFQSLFTVMAAVAVLEAIDEAPGLRGRARIKWVNDVLVDGAKVAGVLAYTQTRADVVASVILGIGLNVEATPQLDRSPFVPAAAALRSFTSGAAAPATAEVLRSLLLALGRLYDVVLSGGHDRLLDIYRARSSIIGSDVRILSDDGNDRSRVIAEGRVSGIGDGLELYLEGHADPITRGRLIVGGTGAEGET